MSHTGIDIEVSCIIKKFGNFTAVNDISFNVMSGEIFGFLGPNGAGKTTLIRILTTLLRPTSGTARIRSLDVVKEADKVRRIIGVVPQAMTSDLDLTAYENMDIYGRFYGISSKVRKKRINDLLEKVELATRADSLVATYSGGMRRRLEIARVLVHRPQILFLDEPSIGLDPQSRRVLWDFIVNLKNEDSMTIFLTTHYMEEVEAFCNRLAIIDAGKIIALGSPNELKAQLPGNDIIKMRIQNFSDELMAKINMQKFVYKTNIENDYVKISIDNGALNLPDLIDIIRLDNGKIMEISIHEQSLEDVFIHYTGKSIRDEDAKKVNFFIGAGLPQRLGR